MSGRKLVIVESPAKAKTINKYLGRDYTVKASMGHIRDLPSKGLSVDIENDFEPTYEVLPAKKKVVAELKKAAAKAETVYLAPDPDREGEAIAWHLRELLARNNKDCARFRRVTFNEITRNAVQQAFAHPGDIEMDRVNSQQARRVLDRIVGYQVSPLLWRRVKGSRSAGRVQSVAVRLIVEREREIRAFVPKEYWSVEAELRKRVAPQTPFHARLARIGEEKLIDVEKGLFLLGNQGAAEAAKVELEGASWRVENVDEQPRKRNPFPPFMTSTLQRAASSRLRFDTSVTMRIAQELYEGVEVGDEGAVGLITYMRTDSLTVSREAPAEALAFIRETFGADYAPETPNVYRSRETAQGAHEAIRPTSVRRTPESVAPYLNERQLALYTLIWKRFVASQMAPAQTLVKTVDILARNERVTRPCDFWFRASSTQITFPGFLKVYGAEEGDEDKMAEEGGEPIPPLATAEMLELLGLKPEQHFTEPPPRYSEATLVKALEELGIGRPSTYAPTISTIQERNYVEKEKGRLKPTPLGETTTDLLVQSFPDLLDVKFTARMEEELDEVESGKVEWHELLKRFYKDFKRTLDAALKTKPPERTRFKCEDCGAVMVIKHGRNGEFLTCSKYPKCKNAANFERDKAGNIHIVEPEKLHIQCPKCGAHMVVKSGEAGEFLACPNYPDCKSTMNFTRDENGAVHAEAPETVDVKCPKCRSPMVIRAGRAGEFLACSAYPKCKSTMNFSRDAEGRIVPQIPEDTGIKCDKCGEPMLIRASRRGPFLACSGYPKCRNAMSFTRDEATGKIIPRPSPASLIKVDEKCDKCDAPMTIKGSRRGWFLACSAYPKCKNAKPLSDELRQKLDQARAKLGAAAPSGAAAARPQPQLTNIECEKCGKPMAIRASARGQFLGCSGYPKCRNAKPLPPDLEIKPAKPVAQGPAEAAARQLKEKKSARPASAAGPAVVAANNPQATTQNPESAEATSEPCEKCGSPMVIRDGRYGRFMACSAYPKCKNTRKLPATT
ncbi:MAG: type I DNA topoisomerase [Verrucomicrobiae bacterium]|nr:type I DNA topoisomerase [Verrucomicrobiae bacterium]